MKRWKIKNSNRAKDAKQNTEDVVRILLENRGIITKKQKEEFFKPPHPQKINPKEFGIDEKQLKKAVLRMKQAVKRKEKIIVYGDYDVDGICGAAVLWETLHFLGARALPHVPDRFTEGYGLNDESIERLKEEDPQLGLIITVDHGIVAHEKIDFARDLGVDVIVTDHHEPGETKPRAQAVVHTTQVSGSGVAWILARELLSHNPQLTTHNPQLDHLGLVALGTVADVLPLIGYNRSFVVHGLRLLRETSRPGIKALCREAAVKQEELDTFHIGFVLGPRLNAMGRVEHAIDSLRLLCTRSKGKAASLALRLGKTNKLRQEKTENTFAHIEENFAPRWADGNLPRILFVHHESYEEGIVGIVAGRLVERYYRPAIVVSRGSEFSRASARSVIGVDIVETIKKAGEGLLESAGGHPMAAGFTTRTENLEALSQRIFELAESLDEEVLLRNVRVDCELSFENLTEELYRRIQEFAPFGYGNPEPTFVTRRVGIKEARLVGRDQTHLKLVLVSGGESLEAIGFRLGEWYGRLSPEEPVDLVYSLTLDEWNGRRRLQLKLKDIKFTGDGAKVDGKRAGRKIQPTS